MPEAVAAASAMVAAGGWLALMTSGAGPARCAGSRGDGEFTWEEPIPLPGSEDRVLALACRSGE